MKPLRIHYLQHVPYEDLGCIESWVRQKGHALSATKFYRNEGLPPVLSFDWLIILGGPMGVHDEKIYPWLKAEKQFIKQAIEQNKTVIGICLGAQLIAYVLGARVYPNKEKEIGWFPVNILNPSGPILKGKSTYNLFHWHGDTFELPDGSAHLASSNACTNQAFSYKEKVLGLQFHLEVTEPLIKQMVTFGRNELVKADYIQNEQTMLDKTFLAEESNLLLFNLLNYLESK